MENNKKYLFEEVKNFVVNVGWTHKIQISQVDIYTTLLNRLKVMKIILTSSTSAGLGGYILEIYPDFQHISMTITFVLSLVTAIIIAVDKESDYKKLAEQNKIAADKYLEMREGANELLYKIKCGEDLEKIQKEFLELKDARNHANPDLPYTSNKAVNLASENLKKRRDNNYTDDYKLFISKALLEIEGSEL